MRNSKMRRLNYHIFNKNNVNINNSRTVLNCTYSSEACFNSQNSPNHFKRIENTLNFKADIIKIILIFITYRLSFIN